MAEALQRGDARGLVACALALLTQAVLLLEQPQAPQPALTEHYTLKASEAAALLGMSVRWLYEHAPELPFARRYGRSWRFSAVGIARYRTGL